MPRPKSYFGDADELRVIREHRNEEIRAWGKQQLANADAVLLGVPTEPFPVSDWDQIAEIPTEPEEEEEEDTNVSETIQLSPVSETIQSAEVPKATPKTRPKPKTE